MEQVRTNWAAMFVGIPDFHAELLASVWVGDTGWAEWHWHGTHGDGSPFAMRGVTLFGIDGDRIVWGRLYMEPVEEAGAGIEEAVQELAHGEDPTR